ncbi:hypothetical protein DFA_01785 [Cavenderia fasciculata]|uniref:C2H2-type domain-containing protein n=1 Tax=Cavenderia fasciculata TaxID=261658 RepID=F4PUN5_CACFS|nr:uncharacterized protein DFA_01785 [Cavenderia fasciculata]EGG21899.1 hypothetical protein DFA_01785 [Cavenderia fasciculata]|eukprot:XP_004359750.1 hypothetical protein DFA_01785 [Cavenderia fasciculata]
MDKVIVNIPHDNPDMLADFVASDDTYCRAKPFENNNEITYIVTRTRITRCSLDEPTLSQPNPPIESVGEYYIKKMEFKALLEVHLTLKSGDKELIKKIRKETKLEHHLGVLSDKLEQHLQLAKLNVLVRKGFKDPLVGHPVTLEMLKSFFSLKIDEGHLLMPVKMEISDALSPLKVDSKQFSIFKSKKAKLDSYLPRIESMLKKLSDYREELSVILEDENMSNYIAPLNTKVSQAIGRLKSLKQETELFGKESFKNIVEEITVKDTFLDEVLKKISIAMGTTETTIVDKGKWKGKTILDFKTDPTTHIPTHQGIFTYLNNDVYKGYCLNGKRHGNGIMIYHPCSIDKIKLVEGEWKSDEVSYPAKITYDDKTEMISNKAELDSWKAMRQTTYLSQSLETRTIESEKTTQFRVKVEKIKDETFKILYGRFKKSLFSHRKQFFAMFLGVTGSGKSTLVEFILNILTGQLGSPQTLRAKDLEAAGVGKSKTAEAYRYDIEYVEDDLLMFTLTLIDTPGFADSNGIDKDRGHIESILSSVSKIERLDNVTYVVPISLTRQTLETFSVLCQVFSILPIQAFDCVSTAITFGDNKNQASNVLDVLNEMLPGIKDKPATFINNPWAQHPNNSFKDNQTEKFNLSGADNSTDININEIAKKLGSFFVERYESQKSFECKGMVQLNKLIVTLMEELKNIKETYGKLSSSTKSLELISNSKDLNQLAHIADKNAMEEYFKKSGYAVKDGKPMAKVIGNELWPNGAYSTVCLAPDFKTYGDQYSHQLETLRQLESKFKELSVFGNIDKILDCSLQTHRQLEAVQAIDDVIKKKYLTDVISNLKLFIDTIKNSDALKKRIEGEVLEITERRKEKVLQINRWIEKIASFCTNSFYGDGMESQRNNNKCISKHCSSSNDLVYCLMCKYTFCEDHFEECKTVDHTCIDKKDRDIIDYHCDIKEAEWTSRDAKHKFIQLENNNNNWIMDLKVKDVSSHLISFFGPTGSGKSLIIRSSILKKNGCEQHEIPFVGKDDGPSQSTSSDINYYIFSVFKDAEYLLDSEGTGGTPDNQFLKGQPEERLHHVEEVYPRLLHLISDLVVYVFSNPREHSTIVSALSKMVSHVESKVINKPHKPHLLVIFNNQKEKIDKDNDFFQSKEFLDEGEDTKIIKSHFTSYKSITVPNSSEMPTLFIEKLNLVIDAYSSKKTKLDTFIPQFTVGEIVAQLNQSQDKSIDYFMLLQEKSQIYKDYKKSLENSSGTTDLEKHQTAIEQVKKKITFSTSRDDLVQAEYLIWNGRCQVICSDGFQCDLILATHGDYHRSSKSRQQKLEPNNYNFFKEIFFPNNRKSFQLEEAIEWAGKFTGMAIGEPNLVKYFDNLKQHKDLDDLLSKLKDFKTNIQTMLEDEEFFIYVEELNTKVLQAIEAVESHQFNLSNLIKQYDKRYVNQNYIYLEQKID